MMIETVRHEPTGNPMAHPVPDLVDQAQLDTLAEDVGPALSAILQTFRDEVRGRLLTMRRLHRSGDSGALSDEAHSIKGSAAAMGLVQLSAAAKKLERYAEAMSAQDIGTQISEIQSSFHQSCVRLVELGLLESILPGQG